MAASPHSQALIAACVLVLATVNSTQLLGQELSTAAQSPYRLVLMNQSAFTLFAEKAVEVNRDTTSLASRPYAVQIHDAARAAAIDPALVHAIVKVESAYNPTALSPKGAFGLMQLMPQTASRYGAGESTHSVELNLRAGTQYLSDLMVLFDGRLDLVLAAYNAGEGAVLRYAKAVPPYRETRRYVEAVTSEYRALARGREREPERPDPSSAYVLKGR